MFDIHWKSKNEFQFEFDEIDKLFWQLKKLKRKKRGKVRPVEE